MVRPGVALDPASLPGLYDAPAQGSIQLWDDEGTFVPCFAELDQYPELEDAERTLLIRPLVPMALGHRIAVALTDQVKTVDGSPMPEVDWFGGVLRGDGDADLAPWQDHYQGLVDQLETLGAQDLVLAFDFPVAADVTSPLEACRDLTTPDGYLRHHLHRRRSGWPFGVASAAPALTGKRIEGTFTTADWLGSDGMTTLDADGVPIERGRGPAVCPRIGWRWSRVLVKRPCGSSATASSPTPASTWTSPPTRARWSWPTALAPLSWAPSGAASRHQLRRASHRGAGLRQVQHADGSPRQGVANTDALVRLVTDGDLSMTPSCSACPTATPFATTASPWGIGRGPDGQPATNPRRLARGRQHLVHHAGAVDPGPPSRASSERGDRRV